MSIVPVFYISWQLLWPFSPTHILASHSCLDLKRCPSLSSQHSRPLSMNTISLYVSNTSLRCFLFCSIQSIISLFYLTSSQRWKQPCKIPLKATVSIWWHLERCSGSSFSLDRYQCEQIYARVDQVVHPKNPPRNIDEAHSCTLAYSFPNYKYNNGCGWCQWSSSLPSR